jgi:hypothetical protein
MSLYVQALLRDEYRWADTNVLCPSTISPCTKGDWGMVLVDTHRRLNYFFFSYFSCPHARTFSRWLWHVADVVLQELGVQYSRTCSRLWLIGVCEVVRFRFLELLYAFYGANYTFSSYQI